MYPTTCVSLRVSAVCSTGRWGRAYCPCMTGGGCRRTYFCNISTVVFVSGKQKIQREWRSDPASIYSTARSLNWLQAWGTWRNFQCDWTPAVRGCSEQCFIHVVSSPSHHQGVQKKAAIEPWGICLFKQIYKVKIHSFKIYIHKQWLMLKTITERKSQLCNLCYRKD